MTRRNAKDAVADRSAFDLWEPHIRSFVTLCPSPSVSYAGPLAGVRVGVKDIIDVEGLPTRNGSAACADVAPATRDAAVVAALRAAGASILGKTVTTEFAFIDPTDCRNPHDIMRSPGGSSSGSGAAVAAGLVDLALGTQTAGSLCRPAAYCGVVGFKTGYGVLSTAGVTPMAASFDAIGIMARSVDLVSRAFEAFTGQTRPKHVSKPRIMQALFGGSVDAAPDARSALQEAGAALARTAEVPVATGVLDCDVDAIIAAHRCVMVFEAAQVHGHLLHPERIKLLQPKFRACLEEGRSVTEAQVSEALGGLAETKAAFWRSMCDTDAILTLPVPEGAPLIDGTTGFQGWLTPWTVFGGPLISVPWGTDGIGRPRAVMLASAPGTEVALLDLAARLEALAPPMPRPSPPGS